MIKNLKSPTTLAFSIVILLFLSSCSSWRYQYPRIKTDKQESASRKEVTSPVEDKTAIPLEEPTQAAIPTDMGTVELTDEAPVKSVIADKTTKDKITGNADNKQQVPVFSFLEKMKENYKLNRVKKTENTTIAGWLRLMIILLAVGLLLIILGVILSFLVSGVFWFIYLIGALCILAAGVILILGLVGVMN